ncbi:MAG: 16S rRNA (cytosine(967)-C(5))-methyltransferase RsmB [Solirubrobacteraceae bacterium]
MSAIAPARVCAYKVVRRVFEEGAYADRAFHGEAAGLDGRDRALAMALAYGTVQRKATLDHLAELLSERPVEQLDPPILAAVRLGLQQILFLDGVADHAAVNDSVELAKADSRGGSGLVNAVLRRAIREGDSFIDGLNDDAPEHAAIKYSVPVWLAQLWFDELGADSARSLLKVVNEPAENALRVNTLKRGVAQAVQELAVKTHPAGELPEGVVVEEPFDAFGSELFRAGAIMPQSRGSMLVSRILDPQPGERILDLCAAPGAKTTHLAALMEGRGELTAVEVNGKRAEGLGRTIARMGADIAEVQVADARSIDQHDSYDRVLVDPPCSGLGTLQSRPDIRWRTNLERLRDVSHKQSEILAAGAAATRPGGTLVYSVCTISRSESEVITEAFLAATPGWELERTRTLRPDEDRTDGFWIARLRRDA